MLSIQVLCAVPLQMHPAILLGAVLLFLICQAEVLAYHSRWFDIQLLVPLQFLAVCSLGQDINVWRKINNLCKSYKQF